MTLENARTHQADRSIVHVAQVAIQPTSGMGRVAWYWRRAFEERGYRFTHLGPEILPPSWHPALFPLAAWRAVRALDWKPTALLLHEPAAFPALVGDTPAVVFSHGLERRAWEITMRYSHATGDLPSVRSRLLYPLWRLLPCDLALRTSPMALVLNREDLEYAERRYGRPPGSTRIVRNGIVATTSTREIGPRVGAAANPGANLGTEVKTDDTPTLLFVGSYLPRKGIATLHEAARILDLRGRSVRWLLAGTGVDRETVLRTWPEGLRARVEVVPSFSPEEEPSLHERASALVLPSFFEGQPLALLQAMANGVCCIASDTCGQRDLIRHGVEGLLFPPGNSEALANAIVRVLDDPSLARRLGGKAREKVAERTWDRVSHEVVDWVEEAVAARVGFLGNIR